MDGMITGMLIGCSAMGLALGAAGDRQQKS